MPCIFLTYYTAMAGGLMPRAMELVLPGRQVRGEGWKLRAAQRGGSMLPTDQGGYNDQFYTHRDTKSQITEHNCSKKTKERFIFLGSLTELAQRAFPAFPFILLQKHPFPWGDEGGSGKAESIPRPPAVHRGRLLEGSRALPVPLPAAPLPSPRPPCIEGGTRHTHTLWSPAQPAPWQLRACASVSAAEVVPSVVGGSVPAAWSNPRRGKQLGKSLRGFFPSSESSLKPGAARPRTQVSFEREGAAPGKLRHGQHWGVPAAGQGELQALMARKGNLQQDLGMEAHPPPLPQPWK